MSTRTKIFISVAVLLAVVGAVAGISAWFAPMPGQVVVSPQGVTNFDMLHLAGPTDVATLTPALMVDCAGLSSCIEIRDASTPVWSVGDAGAVSQTGDQTITGNFIVAGPTAATTGTPMASLNTAADAPDLLVISKDATPVAFVHNSGQVEFDGAINADSTSDFADTVTFSKGSGNAAVIAAGGTLSLPHTADLTAIGYVAIGNGTPNGSVTAGTDEQLYVEGAFEVDGELEADGAIDADSTSDFAGTATFSKGSGNAIVISAGGTLSLPHTADINAIGYVAIGNGTPDGIVTAGTDEQLYVEGAFELDGALDADGLADFGNTVTFTKGSGNAIVVSAGGTISLPHTADITAIGYVAIGNGTPDGSVTAGTDEQLYCEGAFEVDGEAEFDGAIDADSTSDFAGTATFSKGSGNAIVVSAGGTLSLGAGAKIKPSTVTTGTVGVVFACYGSHTHESTEDAVDICEIPANANVIDVLYSVTTQWNDGSSAAVDCGISGGDTDAFVDAMDVNDAADTNRMGDAADMPFAASFIDVGASDVTVICQVAEGTNNASAGAATLVLWYILD